MKDVQNYCDSVVAELGVWKSKMYDVVRRIDKVSSGDKAKLGNQVNDLHIFIEEIENRTDRLRRECPTDWKPDQIEMDTKFTEVRATLDDVWKRLSPGDIGG